MARVRPKSVTRSARSSGLTPSLLCRFTPQAHGGDPAPTMHVPEHLRQELVRDGTIVMEELERHGRPSVLSVWLLDSEVAALPREPLAERAVDHFRSAIGRIAGPGGDDEVTWPLGRATLYLHVAPHPATPEELMRRAEQAQKSLLADVVDVTDRIRELIEGELEQALGDLPPEYSARRHVFATLHDSVRSVIASALEPVLNEQAAAMPQETYEEKKALAKWVNAELRRFGLALKSDRTDRPCILVGNPGNRPGFGRFMLQYADEHGKLQNPLTSVTLPHLALMPDDLTRASYISPKDRGR